MASITFEHIQKTYAGQIEAVKDFTLAVQDKEFVVLVGPSGCGKTTTLRIVAGLEDITDGSLRIGEDIVNHVPAKKRDIAMVFQNYALYPHMSVFDNMAFGLKLRKVPRTEIHRRVHEAAAVLNIGDLLKRRPKALSGGERQRVALGRAMVREPAVFLLDEPLSNLDAKLRASMRVELVKLHKRLGTTFLYVTHDQVEAMTMGDRIVVMNDGAIQQADTPQALYSKPCNRFVAEFIGTPRINFIEGLLVQTDAGMAFQSELGTFPLPHKEQADELAKAAGVPLLMGLRPEDIHTEMPPPHAVALPQARVEVCEQLGNEVHLYLQMGEQKLTARVSADEVHAVGTQVPIWIDMAKVHFFDKDSGKNIVCT